MDHIDAAYNLDLSKPAGAVMNLTQAELKKGFYLCDGFCHPTDRDTYSRYLWEMSPRSMRLQERLGRVQELFRSVV